MATRLHAEQWIERAAQATQLASLYVIAGNEALLQIEAGDALRAAAKRLGYDERQRLELDAQADWSSALAACQSQSLFGGQRLVELSLPTGRPGRKGGESLIHLAHSLQKRDDITVLIQLPYLNQSSLKSKWAQALQKHATWIEAPEITRRQLHQWITQRLNQQNQHCAPETAHWLADQVEGHLLAAHQEILKLGLIYPPGELTLESVQTAVLNVARYNIFDLREALLNGDTQRALRIVHGLEAEGEPLPLVLWVISEELRLLAQLSAIQQAGQDPRDLFRRFRVFGTRQQQVQRAVQRAHPKLWIQGIAHAYDIDQIIKGYPPAQRLDNPWAEVTRLCTRLTQALA